jgi:hypothetical protein
MPRNYVIVRTLAVAENESLNLDKSPRWYPLCQLLASGASIERLIAQARKSFFGTAKPLASLLETLLSTACNQPEDLPRVIREQREHREFAELFRHVARRVKGREQQIQKFMEDVCDRFLDQIGVRCNLSKKDCLKRIREALESDIRYIADRWRESTDAKLRVRHAKGSREENPTNSMIGQSLLGLPRR